MVPLSGSWYGHPCNIPQEEIVCVKSVLIAPFFFWDGVARGDGTEGIGVGHDVTPKLWQKTRRPFTREFGRLICVYSPNVSLHCVGSTTTSRSLRFRQTRIHCCLTSCLRCQSSTHSETDCLRVADEVEDEHQCHCESSRLENINNWNKPIN